MGFLNSFFKDKYDSFGFDKNGFHRNGTRFDDKGFDRRGLDRDGYNIAGYNTNGFNREGLHWNGSYLDDRGFNKAGIHINGTKYDSFGFDRKGYNKENIHFNNVYRGKKLNQEREAYINNYLNRNKNVKNAKKDVIVELYEAKRFLSMQQIESAFMFLRKSAELYTVEIMMENNINSAKSNQHLRIEILFKNNIITRDIYNILDQIRVLGNKSVHLKRSSFNVQQQETLSLMNSFEDLIYIWISEDSKTTEF